MGGTKRQLEEYQEFLINRPHMNADTEAHILLMALEATRLDFEKSRMKLEDWEAMRNRQRAIFAINADIQRSRERMNWILGPR